MAHGPPRRQLHGYVSRDAFDAWHAFARAFDVNVTALLEALAEPLAEASAKEKEADLSPLLRRAVSDARSIAARRSTRHRESD
jgi:hypothetical protein